MNLKEKRDTRRLALEYFRIGLILLGISTVPFISGSTINLLVPTLGLSVVWQVVGLMMILVAIGLAASAMVYLRKSHYWRKKLSLALEEELREQISLMREINERHGGNPLSPH